MDIVCNKCLCLVDESEISWTKQLTNDNVCVYCTHEFDGKETL
jgi:hypothetical protein